MTLSEQQIVPYSASSLRGEKLLVLAPHPDDEVIGCGGLIAQHASEKRQVRVLIATDGAASPLEEAGNEDYRSRRERESIEGLKQLGGPAPQFLRFRDRQLAGAQAELKEILKTHLREFSPDLVAAPSPIEIHPDHVALTRALVELVQADEDLVGDLAMCRVAFYEVSQPIQPNALLDITEYAERKFGALEQHASQQEIRDYQWFARGLNQYRSMTLFPAARYAEAYYVMEMSRLRTDPWSRVAQEVGGIAQVDVLAEPVPIAVVIRTRNRQRWLREAVASVEANRYPASIIVVNDGGASPSDALPASETIRVIDQAAAVGRSEAMNIGVRAAKAPYIAFLDDDDLYYPEHLGTLATAVRASTQVAYYTDAVSSFHEPAEDGSFQETARLRLFAQDFDRDLLLFDNYIPLAALLVSRDEFLAAGGFDPSFDLLEDWDFLVRLTERGSFLRIPRITCEIRHFRGGDSAILSSPEESARFREAKLRIWSKYSSRMTRELIADVFEKQKRKVVELLGQLVDKKGQAKHLETDLTRLDREKTLLLDQLQQTHREKSELQSQLDSSRAMAAQLEHRAEELLAQARAKDQALGEKDELARSLFAEIKRLNDLLNRIYQSRTWKLHELVERIRGRR